MVGRWFSVLMPQALDRHALRNGLVFGGVLIPCCVCKGDSGEVAGRGGKRTETVMMAHACADLLCGAVSACPPGFSESLGVFFHLWEHPQTAELDKPRHFGVTSLGLMSGLGWSVRSG